MSRRKEIAIAFYTISRKEIVRIIRIWTQTILPPVMTMSLYFVIFGSLIGPRIGEMGGFNFMEFIVPGIIMMAVITSSYSNVSSSFFGNKFQRNIEEMLVSPIPSWVIIWGFVSGGVFRGISVGFVVTLVSLFFTKLSVFNVLIIMTSVVLTAILFSLAGMINGILARKFDDVAIVPTFVLTPLTYLGGVFYSISLLPPFWQTLSLLNPVLYMVNLFRYGFLGYSDINIYIAFGLIGVFALAFFLLCKYLMDKGHGMRS